MLKFLPDISNIWVILSLVLLLVMSLENVLRPR